MISTRALSPEVLYAEQPIVKVTFADIACFKMAATKNFRKRIRLCAHRDTGDTLHEMLIVHDQGAYVRPHKHPEKSESFHIIEGLVDVVIFSDHGSINEIIPMGDYRSGRVFFYRLGQPLFHSLLVRSELVIFHETTNGPFNRADTVFAQWAPDEGDPKGIAEFMNRLQGSPI